jgi:hypothetical protein
MSNGLVCLSVIASPPKCKEPRRDQAISKRGIVDAVIQLLNFRAGAKISRLIISRLPRFAFGNSLALQLHEQGAHVDQLVVAPVVLPVGGF